MNQKGLFSASDENSILITAQFYENGRRLRFDRNRIVCFEVELLVPNDITLDHLLHAIPIGIRRYLIAHYDVDPVAMHDNPAYQDEQVRFEQMWQEAQAKGAGHQRPHRTNVRYRKEEWVHNMVQDMWDNTSSADAPHPSAETGLNQWLVCWKVFHECMAQYQQGYPAGPDMEIRKNFHIGAYAPHPVIACGCVSLRKWENGAMLSIGRHPQIWLHSQRDGGKTLRDLGFLSSSRLIFDPIACHHSGVLLDEREISSPFAAEFPDYTVSRREIAALTTTKLQLQQWAPPPSVVHNRAVKAGASIGLFAAICASVCGLSWLCLSGYPDLQTLAYPLAPLAGGLPALKLYRNHAFSPLRDWKELHEPYLRELVEKLGTMREKDEILLNQQYPPLFDPENQEDLLEDILQLRRTIFGRSPDDHDFLHVRIGRSARGSRLVRTLFTLDIPQGMSPVFSPVRFRNIRNLSSHPFELLIPGSADYHSSDCDGTAGYLHELPEMLIREYGFLDDAPVLMDLRRERAIGVLAEDSTLDFAPFLNSLLLDLCANHAPEDLQIVLFGPRDLKEDARQRFIHRFKHLLHFHGLLDELSAFVFDDDHAAAVMDRLHRLTVLRSAIPDAGKRHILVVMMDRYQMDRHPLAQLLPQDAGQLFPERNDISFLTLAHAAEALPRFCSHVLKADHRGDWYYLPHAQCAPRTAEEGNPRESQMYRLLPDPFLPVDTASGSKTDRERSYRCFKLLSALSHNHLSRSALPASLSTLELYERHSDGQFRFTVPADRKVPNQWYVRLLGRMRRYINSQWIANASAPSLSAPIAAGQPGPFTLDLTPEVHGPNLLICGDPGSGKTESMITILSGLAMAQPPEKVRMLLVDPRSGSICDRLQQLPHLIDAIDGSNYAALAQRVETLLNNIREEMVRRMEQFSLFQVRNFREYREAYTHLDTHLRQKLGLIPGRDDAKIQELRSQPPIPHLVVAIDHYDDLQLILRDAPSESLCALMEDGQRFGIHYLLATDAPTQKLSDALLEGFQSRLCLKLSDVHACRQLLGSGHAAMPHMNTPGRSYLYTVPTGRTEYLQMAYADTDIRSTIRDSFRITYLRAGGVSEEFYPGSDDPRQTGIPFRGKSPFEDLGGPFNARKQRQETMHGSSWSAGDDDGTAGNRAAGSRSDRDYSAERSSSHVDRNYSTERSGSRVDRNYGTAQSGSRVDRNYGTAQSGSRVDRDYSTERSGSHVDRNYSAAQSGSRMDRNYSADQSGSRMDRNYSAARSGSHVDRNYSAEQSGSHVDRNYSTERSGSRVDRDYGTARSGSRVDRDYGTARSGSRVDRDYGTARSGTRFNNDYSTGQTRTSFGGHQTDAAGSGFRASAPEPQQPSGPSQLELLVKLCARCYEEANKQP